MRRFRVATLSVMHSKRRCGAAAALLGLSILVGASCADHVSAQRFIGQIQYVATAAQARHGFYYTAKRNERIYGVMPDSMEVPPATELMKSCAYDGNPGARFALVRYYYHWTDAGQSIKSYARWALVQEGLSPERGALVEVSVRASECAVVTTIRAQDPEELDCEYRDNKRSAVAQGIASFMYTGGPGTASLYCPFLEQEGWQKTPLGGSSNRLLGGFAWSNNR